MELQHLKTFRAVCQRLSFSRAAGDLHYAQSTVSAQVQNLEDELGVRLFDRLGRRILLTEAGERLLNYADKMLDLEEEARAEVAEGETGEGALVVRIPESMAYLGLPRAIAAFRKRQPRVRLRFITCAVDGLGEDLRKGVTDLAFLLADSAAGASVELEMLRAEPLVLLAGRSDSLSSLRRVRTRDLAGTTLLLSTADCGYRRGFERMLEEEGVLPGAVYNFGSLAVIKETVAAGAGVTIAPKAAVVAEVKAGRLKILPWDEKPETALLMLRHKDKWLSPRLKAFMEAVREAAGNRTGR